MHEEPKPNHSYIGLIGMAILSSKDKKLVLSDIYQWILDNYNYFRTRGPGWRNSIRHNLSLNDCFVKVGIFDLEKFLGGALKKMSGWPFILSFLFVLVFKVFYCSLDDCKCKFTQLFVLFFRFNLVSFIFFSENRKFIKYFFNHFEIGSSSFHVLRKCS